MEYRIENRFSGSYLYIKGEDNSEEKIDVTGMVSIAREYETKDMSYTTLIMLIEEMIREGNRIEEDNRSYDRWLLGADYIFIACPDSKEPRSVKFIHYNGKLDTDFEQRMLEFAEYVIAHTDHCDKRAVRLAYGFYMQVYRGNYVFDGLIEEIRLEL